MYRAWVAWSNCNMEIIEFDRWKPSADDPRKVEYAGIKLSVMLFFCFSSYHLRYTSTYTPSLAP